MNSSPRERNCVYIYAKSCTREIVEGFCALRMRKREKSVCTGERKHNEVKLIRLRFRSLAWNTFIVSL